MSRKKKSPPAVPWTIDRALRRAARSGEYTTQNVRERALAIPADSSLHAELARYIDREESSLDPEWAALLDMLIPVLRQDRGHGQSVYDRLAKYPPNAVVETYMAQLILDDWGELLPARRHALTAVALAPGLCWPHHLLGLVHGYMGAQERSRADFERSAARCGAGDFELRARALLNQAAYWINHRKDYAVARTLLHDALQAWPEYPEAQDALARLDAAERTRSGR